MKIKIVWTLIALLVVAGLVWLIRTPGKPGQLDAFAQCVTDSGAIYYGAFWCPNCKNQEAKFGRSARLIPRIECSTPDGRGQLPVCQEAGVEGYPTWDFPGGVREVGDISLLRISELTGCELPQQ
jgi:hypothetical protein